MDSKIAKEVAKHVIVTYLSSGCTPDSLRDTYDIRSGNDELLLKHLHALRNIFDVAIKGIEKGDKDGCNEEAQGSD